MPTQNTSSAEACAADFHRDVGGRPAPAGRFDVLPYVDRFVKDRQHRFVRANRSELRPHALDTEAAIVGRTDFDFHPPVLAAHCAGEDRRVISTRRTRVDRLRPVRGGGGLPRWYYCSTFPVFDGRGTVAGATGMMRECDHEDDAPADYRRLTRACEFVPANYAQPIAIGVLAKRANLAASPLQREFARLFRMTPGDSVLRVRLLRARRRLETTSDTAGRISRDCRFFDQGHFTRAVGAAMGLGPGDYRKRFAGTGANGIGRTSSQEGTRGETPTRAGGQKLKVFVTYQRRSGARRTEAGEPSGWVVMAMSSPSPTALRTLSWIFQSILLRKTRRE